MQMNRLDVQLKKTDRQIKQIEARWPGLNASDRSLVRPKLIQLRQARQTLIEQNTHA